MGNCIPDQLEPIEPQALNEIMAHMAAALRAGKRLPPLPDEPIELNGEHLEFYRALRKRFPQSGRDWVFSLAWRLIALSDLVGSGALDDWVISEGNGEAVVPDVVIEVAAGLPLRKGLPFDARAFLTALSQHPVTLTGE